MNNSNILNNTEDLFQSWKYWTHFWRTKLHLSSVTLQCLLLNKKLKQTKSQLKQESVLLHHLTMQSQLDQLDWIHHKLTSSTLLTSPQKLLKVKFRSQKTSKSALLEKKLKLQKPPFWKSSTWNHLNMVWKFFQFTTKEQFSQKASWTLTQHHCWSNCKAVSET